MQTKLNIGDSFYVVENQGGLLHDIYAKSEVVDGYRRPICYRFFSVAGPLRVGWIEIGKDYTRYRATTGIGYDCNRVHKTLDDAIFAMRVSIAIHSNRSQYVKSSKTT